MPQIATAESWPSELPVVLNVHCHRCKTLVELVCQGLVGTVMYETYNEYLCPSCGAQNHAKTPGHIVNARFKSA